MGKKAEEDILALDIDNISKEYYQWKRDGAIKNIIKNLKSPNKKIVRAVDNVSFSVKKGEFLAYAGENGAGKSTTIKILSGIISPTNGKVRVLGFDPQKNRVEVMRRIGVFFGQRTELWWDHPVITSYLWKKQIWNIPNDVFDRNLKMVKEALGLEDIINTFARELSLGQRIKADIGMMLLNSPEVIFLDEPTLGLDVLAKKNVIDILKKINREYGTTIVITSHDMDDLEELADRIILLSNGKIAYDGSFEKLRRIEEANTIYRFSYMGESPRLEGMVLRNSDGHIHEYMTSCIKPNEFLKLISDYSGVDNIEIVKMPIAEIIENIYRRNSNE